MTQTPLRATSQDQHIVVPGTWEQFKSIQKGFEDSCGVRLFYHEGTIELLMPGRDHEIFGHIIGCLLTLFLAKKGVFFQPTGAMTQEREGTVSAQADQSYCLSRAKPIPDLSIEVVFTSGGTNKLRRYQALGVLEVWFWQDGTLNFYRLGADRYECVDRSQFEELADLDIDLLKRCILIAETDPGEAIRVFQQSIF
ncbi:Uma2 family endonuclease [Leptolyngbya sp. AN03gr2]|uniref:Uma2 family endonuclease n=1 Tax=unclassified Leptolyngbya TaxID=2650499 RepID=UPI003D318B66